MLLLLLLAGGIRRQCRFVWNVLVHWRTIGNSLLLRIIVAERVISLIVILATWGRNRRWLLFSVIFCLINIQINRDRLIFLGKNLPYWRFTFLGLILSAFVFIVWLRNTWLPPLLARHSPKKNIINVFDWVSFVVILPSVWFKHFSIVFVSSFVGLLGLSISQGPLVLRSWWFWNMSKLLIIVCLGVALSISSAFRLVSWIVRIHGFSRLLIPRRHPLFQKLQTATRLLDVLAAVICCYHTIPLRGWVIIIGALGAEATVITRLLIIIASCIHVLLIHTGMTRIWIISAVIAPTADNIVLIVLNRVQTWLLPIAVLRSNAQASTDLVVGWLALAVVRSLVTYLIIRVVVILGLCYLAVANTRVASWSKLKN